MATQGYLVIAVGARRYLEMAYLCALSIRHWDQRRPIQLVTDGGHDAVRVFTGAFDHITRIDVAAHERGPLLKLNAAEYAAFDETMFVDGDCLMLKGDADRYWSRLTEMDFCIPGHRRRSGPWYGMNIAEICRAAAIRELVQINSGAFLFRRNPAGKAVFDEAKALHARLGNLTGSLHRGTTPPDEPFLALALGTLGIEPIAFVDTEGRSLMVSTLSGSDFAFDAFDGRPCFTKKTDRISPTIAHFVGLRPPDLYHDLASRFLEAYCPDYHSVVTDSFLTSMRPAPG